MEKSFIFHACLTQFSSPPFNPSHVWLCWLTVKSLEEKCRSKERYILIKLVERSLVSAPELMLTNLRNDSSVLSCRKFHWVFRYFWLFFSRWIIVDFVFDIFWLRFIIYFWVRGNFGWKYPNLVGSAMVEEKKRKFQVAHNFFFPTTNRHSLLHNQRFQLFNRFPDS